MRTRRKKEVLYTHAVVTADADTHTHASVVCVCVCYGCFYWPCPNCTTSCIESSGFREWKTRRPGSGVFFLGEEKNVCVVQNDNIEV